MFENRYYARPNGEVTCKGQGWHVIDREDAESLQVGGYSEERARQLAKLLELNARPSNVPSFEGNRWNVGGPELIVYVECDRPRDRGAPGIVVPGADQQPRLRVPRRAGGIQPGRPGAGATGAPVILLAIALTGGADHARIGDVRRNRNPGREGAPRRRCPSPTALPEDRCRSSGLCHRAYTWIELNVGTSAC